MKRKNTPPLHPYLLVSFSSPPGDNRCCPPRVIMHLEHYTSIMTTDSRFIIPKTQEQHPEPNGYLVGEKGRRGTQMETHLPSRIQPSPDLDSYGDGSPMWWGWDSNQGLPAASLGGPMATSQREAWPTLLGSHSHSKKTQARHGRCPPDMHLCFQRIPSSPQSTAQGSRGRGRRHALNQWSAMSGPKISGISFSWEPVSP